MGNMGHTTSFLQTLVLGEGFMRLTGFITQPKEDCAWLIFKSREGTCCMSLKVAGP